MFCWQYGKFCNFDETYVCQIQLYQKVEILNTIGSNSNSSSILKTIIPHYQNLRKTITCNRYIERWRTTCRAFSTFCTPSANIQSLNIFNLLINCSIAIRHNCELITYINRGLKWSADHWHTCFLSEHVEMFSYWAQWRINVEVLSSTIILSVAVSIQNRGWLLLLWSETEALAYFFVIRHVKLRSFCDTCCL